MYNGGGGMRTCACILYVMSAKPLFPVNIHGRNSLPPDSNVPLTQDGNIAGVTRQSVGRSKQPQTRSWSYWGAKVTFGKRTRQSVAMIARIGSRGMCHGSPCKLSEACYGAAEQRFYVANGRICWSPRRYVAMPGGNPIMGGTSQAGNSDAS